jgi:hypothetical protein
MSGPSAWQNVSQKKYFHVSEKVCRVSDEKLTVGEAAVSDATNGEARGILVIIMTHYCLQGSDAEQFGT